MNNKRQCIGVIGLGMASLPHAKSLLALSDRVEVRAAYSRSKSRRDEFAARFALPVVNNVEAVIDDPDISTVLLLTPPNARTEYVQALAGRGKHVLVEKPLERTTQAAKDIVELCEASGVQLGVVFQHRFRDASLALRSHMSKGNLGQICTVQLSVPWWREQSYYDEPGRGSYARDGGGVLISQAIHSLDLMLSLLGPVSTVAAIAGTTPLHSMESEDFVGAGLHFDNGAMGAVMASTANYPGRSESLCIVGDKATATLAGGELVMDFRDGRQEIVGESAGSGGGSDPMDFPHDWHQRLIEDFLQAVDTNQTPSVSGRDALAVHRLIDALLLSAKQEKQISPGDIA